MTETCALKQGDLVLLFNNLPFDYESDLPVSPFHGVILAEPPYALLQSPDEDHMPCYVLPGTKLAGMGMNHCCLINENSAPPLEGITRTGLLFTYLAALRLLAPAAISVAGHFTYGGSEDPFGGSASLVNMHSAWQPHEEFRYTEAHFTNAGRLLDRIVCCLQNGPERLRYAYLLFAQVTNGFSLSYQMSILGLYAALEAIFAPGGQKKAKTLGSRTASWLGKCNIDIDISEWIFAHYVRERHALAHGFWQLSPEAAVSDLRGHDFGVLHEILRLSLLGFFSQDAKQVSFLNVTGPRLQSELDALQPGGGVFLDQQKMWLSRSMSV